jgi:ribosome maturation factor RimP
MFAYEKLPGLPRERLLDAIDPVLRAHGLAGVEIVWRTDAQGRVLVLTLESADAAEPGRAEPAEPELAQREPAEREPAEREPAEREPGQREPGQREPGAGVTLEVCSRVSRDLSTAFDVLELFDGNYRLEVGSPGLERRLYTLADYRRFSGKLAKLKLASPVAGQSVLTGRLGGVDAEGRVLLEGDDAPRPEPETKKLEGTAVFNGAVSDPGASARAIAFEQIRSGQLVVDWREMGFSPLPPGQRTARARQRAGRRSAARGRQ